MPKYTRYLRDIVANKRRHMEFETFSLTEECSARVQSKLPPKLKDHGCFTIPMSLGKQKVGRALSDLGASINLMSSSLFKQLGLGVLRPTTITLQLTDTSLVMPEGIIEDVEGKLKMRVGNEEITFNVYKALKLPKHYQDLCMITTVELKGIEQSPDVNYSDSDRTTELDEVVLQGQCVRMIEKRARDEKGDLLRECKKASLNGR
ncbi:uncharacterized protein LOC107776822 [Nicotiana tabacum]|uniref:Uncharacterized protein LOC107776822 n=1 Tax=Nicotiana tabacum TaxID=4097 RepID=A0AC58UR62_TOBAC